MDSPLGGAAVFSLSDGLGAMLPLPQGNRFMLSLAAEKAPQKNGESRTMQPLILGLPRLTDYTKNLPSTSTEVVERFYHDFGLDGGKTGYSLEAQTGKVVSQRYILNIDGKADNGFSGQLTGNLISSLPITVANLNDNWSSYLYDRTLKKALPIGMFEGQAWATVCLNGKLDLFVRHPVIAVNPNVTIQVTQSGDNAWKVELHNATEKPMKTTIRKNPDFDPLKEKPFGSEQVETPAGGSVWREM